MEKILILGIGNPIRGDDAIGFHVIKRLQQEIHSEFITITETSESSLCMLDLFIGYKKIILIDAIYSAECNVGSVVKINFNLKNNDKIKLNENILHNNNLYHILHLGNKIGLNLPNYITIFGVKVCNVDNFTEHCTADVLRSIPKVIKKIKNELKSI